MIDRRGILAGLIGLIGFSAFPISASASPTARHQMNLRRLILRLQDDISVFMGVVPGVHPYIVERLWRIPEPDEIVNVTNAYLNDLVQRGIIGHPIVYSTENEPFQMSVFFTMPEQARRCEVHGHASPSYGILFQRGFPRGIPLDLRESEPWFAPAGLSRGKLNA